jgi:hypothetical protein
MDWPVKHTSDTRDSNMSAATAQSKAPAVVNGVNVTALFGVIDAVEANPEIAKFNFRLMKRWPGGVKTRSTIKEFTGTLQTHRAKANGFAVDSGEPPVLLGEDSAPNPGEWLLHLLVGCVTTTIVYHAAARDIATDAISSEVEGDIDLRGFLGLAPNVRGRRLGRELLLRSRSVGAAVCTRADRQPLAGSPAFAGSYSAIYGFCPVSSLGTQH